MGLLSFDSNLTVDGARIDQRAAINNDVNVADGVDVVLGTASLQRLFLHDSPRTGVAVFGATVELGQSVLECSAIHLDGEVINSIEFLLPDLGGNRCGCGDATEACKTLSSSLTPPAPID